MGNNEWHRKIYTNWWTDLNLWRTTLDDEERSSQPSTSQSDDHCAEVDALIQENPIRLSHVWASKRSLACTKVCSDYEAQDTVHMWLWSQPKTFFADGIRRLVSCYKIYAEKRSDYVKQITHFIFVTDCCTWSNNTFTPVFDSALYDICMIVCRLD
jgi:hypothetical protein